MIDSRLLTPTKTNIVKAAEILLSGNLVAFPTETVYGLGASATHEKGISRIYQVKGRPIDHPLIVHISSISKLQIWAKEIPNYALELANKFWPGPMTLILRRTDVAKDFITGAQDTVGLRIPNNEIALGLLHQFENIGGLGIAAPSANRFGAVSPTSASHVIAELANHFISSDLVIDGGDSKIGIESTIIDCTLKSPKILRPGALTSEEINTITNLKLSNNSLRNETKFSGSFDLHYSPKARVFLNIEPKPSDGFIALNKFDTPKGVIRLSSPIHNEEFAAQLYASLRHGDELNLSRIVVFTPDEIGIGVAINDRLRKASEKL